ncbi:unnamed protein product [Ostreobium quekettii]|uniref:Bromodomain-containing protein n=1 Tax=Ostreobium quekettii TaxID=121088 RepID=A0A8S1IQC1_9CHLO|nr:unnamed protein product [Ostreobium quekettii]|eukprot:evm.model.scf_685.2 EVM.evm.TU.scf_685.2   scf_685:33876-39167(+)
MASSAPMRKPGFLLRLDDGGVVGPAHRLGFRDGDPNRPVYLPVAEAHKRGLVGGPELSRLAGLVNKGRALLKRQADAAELPVGGAQRGKRPRVAGQDPPSDEQAHRGSFVQDCLGIIEQIEQDLGKNAYIFNKPVNRMVVPDYYDIVKNPMDLGTLRENLLGGKYAHPEEFAKDMRLVWSNCSLYNKKGDLVERLGNRASLSFENRWAMSGFADESRSKRPTVGLQPSNHNPGQSTSQPENVPIAKEKKVNKVSKTASHKQPGPGGPSASSSMDVAMAAPPSRRPPAKPASPVYPDRPMSTDQMQDLAEGLRSLEVDVLEDVIKIVRESSRFVYKDCEEIELDISDLDNKTCWKLAAFLKDHGVQGTSAQGEGLQEKQVVSTGSQYSDSDAESGFD